MEDLKINLKENGKKQKTLNNKSRKKHWTLILVGEYGEMFYVRKFKTLVTLNILTILILCIGLILFVFLGKNKINENRELKKELNALRDKTAALQDEKDMLMVRLVVAESAAKKKDESASLTKKKSSNKIIDKSSKKKPRNKENIKGQRKESKKRVEKKNTASSRSEVSTGVDIKEFLFSYDSDHNTIKSKFKLINTSINNKPVSGYAFVILKSDKVAQDKWLVSPLVELKDGLPLNIKKGRFFSISRYTFLRFEEKITIDPSKFNKVYVYIFSLKEKLLLQKVFPVKIDPKPVLNIPGVNTQALDIKDTPEKKINKNIIKEQIEVDGRVDKE